MMDQEQIEERLNQVVTMGTTYGMSVIGAIVILIIGMWFSGKAKKWTLKAFSKSEKMDITVATFLASMVKYAVIAFTLIAVLERFGVQTTSFVAVLGAMGLAVGLSLQGTLGHVASGVMLLMFRPFKVGQFVEAGGISGTVKGITLFSTELDTPDNKRIIVPNGNVWGQAITNFNFHDTRRVDMLFGIGYGDDVDKAMGIIRDCIARDTRIHQDPEPFVMVTNLNDSSVDITVRVWALGADYWGVMFDTTKAVKLAFDEQGIEIPFPQTVIHQAAS